MLELGERYFSPKDNANDTDIESEYDELDYDEVEEDWRTI
jgi:hypothetical protein